MNKPSYGVLSLVCGKEAMIGTTSIQGNGSYTRRKFHKIAIKDSEEKLVEFARQRCSFAISNKIIPLLGVWGE
jgi:hypothetical protein